MLLSRFSFARETNSFSGNIHLVPLRKKRAFRPPLQAWLRLTIVRGTDYRAQQNIFRATFCGKCPGTRLKCFTAEKPLQQTCLTVVTAFSKWLPCAQGNNDSCSLLCRPGLYFHRSDDATTILTP